VVLDRARGFKQYSIISRGRSNLFISLAPAPIFPARHIVHLRH
jgi:hypothetical protein